jgi:hypothetical protein
MEVYEKATRISWWLLGVVALRENCCIPMSMAMAPRKPWDNTCSMRPGLLSAPPCDRAVRGFHNRSGLYRCVRGLALERIVS